MGSGVGQQHDSGVVKDQTPFHTLAKSFPDPSLGQRELSLMGVSDPFGKGGGKSTLSPGSMNAPPPGQSLNLGPGSTNAPPPGQSGFLSAPDSPGLDSQGFRIPGVDIPHFATRALNSPFKPLASFHVGGGENTANSVNKGI